MEETKEESPSEDRLIEERKKKLKEFFLKKSFWVLGVLIIALILGIYIRSLPMSDHNGKPGLWDITTDDWTLGPDLDPFLFLRYAKTIVEQGSLPRIDMMRNIPLGFDTTTELPIVSYTIVLTYKIINLFGSYNVNYAAVVMPVLIFALTIIVFFLFVREIFIRKDDEKTKLKANLIASISTFFMIVIPVFLSRTVAGIPEKESVAFFFMFLSFYLFLKAWKTEKLKLAIFLGGLSGIATGLMGLTWGAVIYVYITIAIASLIVFLFNKVGKKEMIIYSIWTFIPIILTQMFSNRIVLKAYLTSIDTGLTFLVFGIMLIHLILWKTRISEISMLKNSKIQKNVITLIVSIIFFIIIASMFFGTGFIIEKIKAFHQIMFKPVTGRWSMTVAENRQPYFTEWRSSFGPFIKNIPVMFWLFFIGSVVLFKKMLKAIKKKDAWILTALFVLFLFGLIFSRYSSSSILNGENFASKLLYYGSAFLLIGAFAYYYKQYKKENNQSFDKLEYEYLFAFSLFILCLFTARSAVRLIMTLGPVAPIFSSYLAVESFEIFKKTKEETKRIFAGIALIIILLLSLFAFWGFYKEIKSQAYGFIPSSYTQQWQKAMAWVRENTPKDSVFAHWWDYGYWLQSIGDRATVTDGGNAIVWWNYLTGRLVLTGDNQKQALEFLYNHNATHLLIDSTDIGKYTAYSSIGSNKDYDRFSWVPIMSYDSKQIQETKEGKIRIYQGGSGIDEDILYQENETKIFLPAQKAAIVAVLIETKETNNSQSFKQPEAVFYYQGKQIKIPLRYIYYNNILVDFKTGLNSTVYIIPNVYQTGQGVQIDKYGVIMYLSPRMMKGLFAQLYLLNDPFKNFQNFELTYSQPSMLIENLNQQGANLNEFTFFGDVQGPIKIWKIRYSGEEKYNLDYLLKSPPSYIDWVF